MKTLNLFSHSMNEDVTACEGGVIISMQGYNRFQDFYLCVPAEGLYYRAANNRRYGLFMVEVFMDGEFIGATRMDKRNYIKRLYEAGHKSEAREYALGYRLWRETSLGGRKINAHKEAARISHAMCDMDGKRGHEVRQSIRKHILYGTF